MATFPVKSQFFGENCSMENFLDKFSRRTDMVGLTDRFSRLPDTAVFEILRRLNVEDLSQLMQVSQKCNKLCMSVPVLWVSNWKHVSDSSSLKRYMSLVENFLDRRCKKGNEVNQLKFTWNWKFLEETESTEKQATGKAKNRKRKKVEPNPLIFRVSEYILRVIRCCGTKSANLWFISPEGRLQELDPRFFGIVPNLNELTVRTNLCTLRIFKMPFPTPSNLEKLTLMYCKLNDDEISWIVDYLPALKELCLHYCINLLYLTLQSKSLEHLRIVNQKLVAIQELKIYCPLQTLFVQWYPVPDARTAFIICSEELKEFEWHGAPLGFYYARPSVHLLKASIHLQLPSELFPWDLSRLNADLLDDVIDQLKTTKSLKFHGNTIQLFYMEECSLSPLSNVESVAIEYCVSDDKQVPAIAFFLKEMLKLKSLSITSCGAKKQVKELMAKFHGDGMRGFNMEFWETQGLKFVPQLKEATIEAAFGNGVELVKFLLKYGTSLETMKIVCLPGMESSILEQVADYNFQSTAIIFTSI